MAAILFFQFGQGGAGREMAKSHVKGYTKKNGAYVGPYQNKVFKKMTIEHGPHEIPDGYHPQLNDKGHKVAIKKFSQPTQADTWSDPDAVATITAHDHSMLPDELNGVPLSSWSDAPRRLHDWADVEGQVALDEPELKSIKGLKQGSGVVVREPDGRVWIVHPTNQFGGYNATFPKGTLEEGLPLQASAIKEAYEESGLKVEIIGYLVDVERTTSVARYYTARRVGGSPADMGWESQSVSLVPVEELHKYADAKADEPLIEAIKKMK